MTRALVHAGRDDLDGDEIGAVGARGRGSPTAERRSGGAPRVLVGVTGVAGTFTEAPCGRWRWRRRPGHPAALQSHLGRRGDPGRPPTLSDGTAIVA
jgi:hypothetical protein